MTTSSTRDVDGDMHNNKSLFLRKQRRWQILESSSFGPLERLICALIVVIAFLWLLGIALLFSHGFALPRTAMDTNEQPQIHPQPKQSLHPFRNTKRQTPYLLSSKDNDAVTVKASFRGNLGPPSVILNSGSDWIKDRWQAASDMHGTAIKGSHWVEMEFKRPITRVTKVVIDWEAAFARDYRIEGQRRHFLATHTNNIDTNTGHSNNNNPWKVFYDGGDPSQEKKRQVTEYGQSPGVKTKTPLHVVHTIEIGSSFEEGVSSIDTLRIFIRRPAVGWGVSIWHVDVYGMDGMETD